MAPTVVQPLPCCYYDGRPCWEQWVEFADVEAAKQACRDSGGCPGSWNFLCADWDCDEEFGAPVSCCDPTDGTCYDTYAPLCQSQYGGVPLCPEGCVGAQQITCEQMATELHVCCIDAYPSCAITTYGFCLSVGGNFLWHEDECNELVCGVGCRETVDSYVPTSGPEWGQKEYTLDICYPVAMMLAHPLSGHEGGVPRGRGRPVTSHEVRAVAQSGEDDPCAHAYGVLARGERGRMRPYLCSQPHPTDTSSAAYSQGFFAKSPDNLGVVPRGRMYMRVGVMTEPNREVQYQHPKLICGGIS